MKICILSQQHFSKRHVSEDMIDAIETALLNVNGVTKLSVSELIYKINVRLKNVNISFIDHKIINELYKARPDFIFIGAMSPTSIRFQVNTLRRINIPKVVYCIDTWESKVEEWKDVLTTAKVDYVLCAYKNSVSQFRKFIKNVEFLPQSMNSRWFYPRKVKKTRLFMQIGRKNSTLDSYVLRYLKDHNLPDSEYVRETERGKIIFPDFEVLANEICKTKFFIVSPRNIDEINITGNISDVTARFYEGMACKSLLIGYKPKDTFDVLFPQETAMITVSNYEDFASQIDYYIKNENEYNNIVDLNYDLLILKHTWSNRTAKIIDWLNLICEVRDNR